MKQPPRSVIHRPQMDDARSTGSNTTRGEQNSYLLYDHMLFVFLLCEHLVSRVSCDSPECTHVP